MILVWGTFLGLISVSSHAFEVLAEGQPRKGWSFVAAGALPVHAGGRIKPLDTYARELVMFQTGSRRFQGWEPLDLMFSWLSSPNYWDNQPFIQVTREDTRRQLGLDIGRTRFSPKELIQTSYLAQYADKIGGSALANPPLAGGAPKQNPREQELKRLLDRIGTYRAIVSGEGWPVVPGESQGWGNLAGGMESADPVRLAYAEWIRAYALNDRASFESMIPRMEEIVSSVGGDGLVKAKSAIRLELIYSRARPNLWAWVFYVLGGLLWAIALGVGTERGKYVARVATGFASLGFLIHIGGMIMRMIIAGRPPVTNMYESVIWAAFGVMLFAGIISIRNSARWLLMGVASTVAAVLMIVADAAPGVLDAGIHPLVPVLRSNYWLTIHVLTITLGYSAFALTLGLGNVSLFQYFKGGTGRMSRVVILNQLTYRAMQFGVVLLAAGTILGGVWADYSWGRFWGWDPKEVWALIALLGYVALLHARYTGWIASFGFAAWSVVGFLLVVMAWYGVNFVLGVGLHSYGFAAGGRGWVAGFCVAQIAFVVAAWFAKKRGGGVIAPGLVPHHGA